MSESTAIADVARDLVELCRVAEAIDLLDAELADRHDVECSSCGAWGGWQRQQGVTEYRSGDPCREPGWIPCVCGTAGVRFIVELSGPDRPSRRYWGPCSDCGGRGWNIGLVPMLVPHESRLLARRKP